MYLIFLDASSKWSPKTVVDISGALQKDVEISKDAKHVLIRLDSDCYVNIDNVADTAITANDMIFNSNNPFAVQLPRKAYNQYSTLYVHIKQVTSATTKYARVLEM